MKRLALFLSFVSLVSLAEVRLPAWIGDHMVLQRDKFVHLWGWADPDETVTITDPRGDNVVRAGTDGKWRLDLPAFPATAEPFEITFKAGNTIVVKDVVVGEVWLCTGQSNMGTPLGAARDVDDILAAADTGNIRLFRVANTAAPAGVDNVRGQWARSTVDLARPFTGVGYVFGYELQQALGVPVGLIQDQWGGTRVEAWTARDAMLDVPALQADVERFEEQMAKADPNWRDPARFAELLAGAEAYHQEWSRTWRAYRKEADAAKEAGTEPPPAPRHNPPSPLSKNAPCVLYNGMIAPMTTVSVRGFIWYQGESNAGRGLEYRDSLRQMIVSWRAAWEDDNLPFFIVQLPAIGPPATDANAASSWANLRESQWLLGGDLRQVWTTVNYDIDPTGNLHPVNKRPVGHRLALAALANVYQQQVEWRGPRVTGVSFFEGTARIEFTDVGDGLKTSDGGPLQGFAIAGEDGKYVWGEATIRDKTCVVVRAEGVDPKAVRYAWSQNPSAANLVNSAALPAVPFRHPGRPE